MNTRYQFLSLFIFLACQTGDKTALTDEFILLPADSLNLDPHGFSMVSTLTKVDSVFFLIDRSSKLVAKTSLQFEPLVKYRAIGAGPGEFSDPFDLSASVDNVYVIDLGQRKLIEFSNNLDPIDELIPEFPPFSVQITGERQVWIGSFDMEYEDVYMVDFNTRKQTLHPLSLSVEYPLEGISFHSKHHSGTVLRYRQFTNRLDVFRPNGDHITFFNPTQPQRPELDSRIPEAPLFKSKIHNSAFLTADRACVLSGDHTPGNQPVQCFDFSGQLLARYSLKQDPSMISVYTDSTLYTYSPKTNHIYVYHLGF
jgi:hypothetical protein